MSSGRKVGFIISTRRSFFSLPPRPERLGMQLKNGIFSGDKDRRIVHPVTFITSTVNPLGPRDLCLYRQF
jgi:hypothetical protein